MTRHQASEAIGACQVSLGSRCASGLIGDTRDNLAVSNGPRSFQTVDSAGSAVLADRTREWHPALVSLSNDAGRLSGVDAGRLVAVASVPFIHVAHADRVNTWLDLSARFAVPFFFVVSGYFLANTPINPLPAVARTLRRLGIPFALWCAVYLVMSGQPIHQLADPQFVFLLLTTGGPGHHLWFLPALGIATVIMIFLRKLTPQTTLLIAAALYTTGLILGSYGEPLLGLHNRVWLVRNGVLFGFPFIAIGFHLAKHPPELSARLAAALFLFGGLLQASEAMLLSSAGYTPRYDLLIGTVPFGVGAFLLALKLPPSKPVLAFAIVGRYSFGIYALHLMGLWIINYFLAIKSLSDSVLAVSFSLLFAISISFLLGQVRFLRGLVR
jgi:surface polysaccharide O-acyltransferase-like enzyme